MQWWSWHVCSFYGEWSMDEINGIQDCWWMEALVLQWSSCWVPTSSISLLAYPTQWTFNYFNHFMKHARTHFLVLGTRSSGLKIATCYQNMSLTLYFHIIYQILTRNWVNYLCWLQVYSRIWQKSYFYDYKGLCLGVSLHIKCVCEIAN